MGNFLNSASWAIIASVVIPGLLACSVYECRTIYENIMFIVRALVGFSTIFLYVNS